ncbi:MAG: GGDEF domain-containing protein [Clostridiales bacterium]|nr:GGDEF domain-containing protein [Clostridiales bacterium]
MGTAIDLTSVFVSDAIGVLLLIVILATRGWSLPARKKESLMLFIIILSSITNCLADALMSYYDGIPGKLVYVVSMIGNTYLYLYNLIVGIGIIYLIVVHVDKSFLKLQEVFFLILSVIEISILIINPFYPLVFSIDSHNIYHRESFYWIFILAAFLLIVYGYTFYFVSKVKNPSLRYFPVWQFLLPILLGVVVQSRIYGISLFPVSFAVAFCGLVICLQNECIYIDKLTGVYNRYELDKLGEGIGMKKNERVAGLMLDLNGFKQINDTYSHEEGDKALVAFSKILVNVIKGEGVVIRLAGDEFIIVVRKFKEDSIDRIKEEINKELDAYNSTSGKPYKLSTAIGGSVFDLDAEGTEEFLSKIDHLMYKDKKDYYRDHSKVSS